MSTKPGNSERPTDAVSPSHAEQLGQAVRLDLKLTSLIPIAAVGLRLLSSATTEVSYVLLAVFALLGRAQAIQALALSWLFNMLNGGVVTPSTVTSIGRYAVLAAATLSVVLWSILQPRRSRNDPMIQMTLFLGAFLLIHSLLFSVIVDVSVLKAVSWTMAMGTVFVAWAGLSTSDRDKLAAQLFAGLIVIMLVSLPLLVMRVGYRTNDTGFQGILNHPQAFGPTMALLGAWAASRMLGAKRPSWLIVGLFVACLILVVLSEARTGGFALLLGVAVAVMLVRVSRVVPCAGSYRDCAAGAPTPSRASRSWWFCYSDRFCTCRSQST